MAEQDKTFDIRTAALDDIVEQRVRLAVSLLPAYRLRGQVSSWDGTRCDLLIASAGDTYGYRALELAVRRDTPVIALGDRAAELGLQSTNPFSTATSFARDIQACLCNAEPEPDTDEQAHEEGDAVQAPTAQADTGNGSGNGNGSGIGPDVQPAVCLLASVKMRGRAVNIKCNGRIVMLRPEFGRAYASSHADLLALADDMSESARELETIEQPPSAAMNDMASCSIEAFVLRAADRASERLPDFPEGRYRLESWPDLGAVPTLITALNAARVLIRAPMTTEELHQAEGLDEHRSALNACLWGLAAANLLVEAAPTLQHAAASAPRSRIKSKVWTSIARRFGLLST